MMETWTPPKVIGIVQQPDDAALFARLGLPVEDSQPQDSWALTRLEPDGEPLTLIRSDGVALYVDFSSGKALHRTHESGKGAQAMAKALGIKQFHKAHQTFPVVIDATGGLGQDAWALASLGCKLHIIESHPLVHALLADGLQRASQDEKSANIATRVSLLHDDAAQRLIALNKQVKAHAIYLDPMYPAKRKRANSKKGMQFLQSLLGPATSTQSPDLLASALACNVSRVAVKRPKGAMLLAGSEAFAGQRTVIDTPNTRYDVYHRKPGAENPNP